MPLPGKNYVMQKICGFICIFTVLTTLNTFSQNKNFAKQEDKLDKLYSKMVSFYYEDMDSLEIYAKKFEKDFKRFIKSNPGTLKYNFPVLSDETNNPIHTTSDGKFRIYNWDTENRGPDFFYKSIYQWQGNGKVFTDISNEGKDVDAGSFCSDMYTVMIDDKVHYLVIKSSAGPGRYQGQSISAYRIEGEKLLDTVKVFKTKTGTLNRIGLYYDHYSVVDDHDQTSEITYDAQQQLVSIPLVNDTGVLTNKFLLYQLKGRYFEYIGTKAPGAVKN